MSKYMQTKNKRESRRRRLDQQGNVIPKKPPMTGAERMRRYRARRAFSHLDQDVLSIVHPGSSGTEEIDHRTAFEMDILSPPNESPLPESSMEQPPFLSSVNAGEINEQSTPVPGADKYQLKWHSHQQNLNSCISGLYKNDRYADVTLITCNNDENFTIRAHKLVLGTSSTYFANIFDKNLTPPNAMTYIVLPPELTRRSIQTLIQYMYTGESTVSVDILNEVLRGGEILKIRGLWRNQTETVSSTDHAIPRHISGQIRQGHRISVDRVPLQEPRLAQNPATVHDSPVIVTNPAKSYGISQSAQMPSSSTAPAISIERMAQCTQKRQSLKEESNKPTTSQPKAADSSSTQDSSSKMMPDELSFLTVKEEPVEWTDVNSDEMSLDKSIITEVKVEMNDCPTTKCVMGDTNQEQIYSPLTCELCKETFTIPADWVRHIENHDDAPHTMTKRRRRTENDDEADITAALKCDLCATYFVTPAEWVRHVQSTHTETELAMSNKSSSSRRSSKSSTTDMPQQTNPTSAQQQEKTCSICNKSFPSYASMIIHKRTHTGERPFYCEICSKGFNVKSNLLRHMRTLHNQQGDSSPSQGDQDSHCSE